MLNTRESIDWIEFDDVIAYSFGENLILYSDRQKPITENNYCFHCTILIICYIEAIKMYLGQLFGSYCEFMTNLKAFQDENFVCFSKRDSRKIESVRHKVKHPLNPELEFYEIKFNCIRGGPLCYKGSGKRKTR